MFCLVNRKLLKNLKQGNGKIIFLVKKVTRSSMEKELEETRWGPRFICNNPNRNEKCLH